MQVIIASLSMSYICCCSWQAVSIGIRNHTHTHDPTTTMQVLQYGCIFTFDLKPAKVETREKK